MKKTLVIVAAVLAAPTITACIIAGMVAVQELRFNRALDKLDPEHPFAEQN